MTAGLPDTAYSGSVLDDLTRLVREHSGLEVPETRKDTLARVADRSVVTLGLNGPSELYRRLSDPAYEPDLVDFIAALTIGETHFFRNSPQFELLRTHVLPALIASRLGTTRRLRIWSAASSSGEEAYSLAMLVDQLLPGRAGWEIEIVGTDINPDALTRARAGVYGQWSFRQAPEDMVRRYFAREGKEYRLDPRIREMVSFGYLNLAACEADGVPPAFRQMDLILCRNVFIYFSPETVERIARRLAEALSPDGWFITGHAESPMPVFRQCFAARDFPQAVLYQARGAGPQPPPADVPRPRPAVGHGTDGAARPVNSRAGERDSRDRSPRLGPPSDRPVAPRLPQPTVRELCARAEVSWRAGATDSALADLRRAAERDTRDERPVFLAAKILAGARQLDAALHTIRHAIERAPSAAPSHHLHGMILQESGCASDALEAFRRCVYLDPGHVLGHVALATMHASAGAEERAERSLATASELIETRSDDDVIDDDLTVGDVRSLVELNRSLLSTTHPRG